MKIKIKSGEKITGKEFMKRWKSGIESLSPIQRLQNDKRSTFTMMIGYLVGLIALIIKFDLIPNKALSVALIIIFLGAFWSNLIKWIALRQQVKLFKNMDLKSIDLNKILDNLGEKVDDKKEIEVIGGKTWDSKKQ